MSNCNSTFDILWFILFLSLISADQPTFKTLGIRAGCPVHECRRHLKFQASEKLGSRGSGTKDGEL